MSRVLLLDLLSPSCEETVIAINTRLNLSTDGWVDLTNSTQICTPVGYHVHSFQKLFLKLRP